MEQTNTKFLNRDTIKYIAMFTMLLNHVANVFLPSGILKEALIDIGYFTAITMCYFLVEGYEYTRSKKKYTLRLFIFAVVSEIPFCLAFTDEGYIEFHGMNMIFTLFLCFLIIGIRDKVKNITLGNIMIMALIIVSIFSDWAMVAPLFTLYFIDAKGNHKEIVKAYAKGALLFGGINLSMLYGEVPIWQNVLCTLGGMLAIGASGVCIVCFYNGKRMEKGRTFSKWFFYIFYPAHLLIIGLLRIATMA